MLLAISRKHCSITTIRKDATLKTEIQHSRGYILVVTEQNPSLREFSIATMSSFHQHPNIQIRRVKRASLLNLREAQFHMRLRAAYRRRFPKGVLTPATDEIPADMLVPPKKRAFKQPAPPPPPPPAPPSPHTQWWLSFSTATRKHLGRRILTRLAWEAAEAYVRQQLQPSTCANVPIVPAVAATATRTAETVQP